MQPHKQRPVNLNLLAFQFPSSAIASILHRISGVITFLLIPFLLWLLDLSLRSAQAFADMQHLLTGPIPKFMLWGFLTAFVYHLLAGIRHLLMDCGVAEELRSGQLSAQLVISLSVLAAVGMGVWLW